MRTSFSDSREAAKDWEEDLSACARVRREVVRVSCSERLCERRVSVARVWDRGAVGSGGEEWVEVEIAVVVAVSEAGG